MQPGANRTLERAQEHLSRWNFLRSGWVTSLLILLALLIFGVGWRAHQRARFHRLTATIIPATPVTPAPGGQEAISLSRMALLNNTSPEFVNAVVLPGIGMQLLQMTVAVPDQGDRDLLDAPGLNQVLGTPANQVKPALLQVWESNRHIVANYANAEQMIGSKPATGVENQTMPDGGQATGNYQQTDEKGNPLINAAVTLLLSGRTLDLTVRAKNVSTENRFVAFAWSPRLLAPAKDLSRLKLAVPSTSLRPGAIGVRSSDGAAAGLNFSTGQPTTVGTVPVDGTYVRLTDEFLGDGPVVRLVDTQYGITLRFAALGASIRSLHVATDPQTGTLLLGLNSMDPSADPEQQDQTLRPGQTLQWHLRMEVSATNAVSPEAHGSGDLTGLSSAPQ